MRNERWEMGDDGRISEAPFVSTLHTPHSAAMHVGLLAKSLLRSSVGWDDASPPGRFPYSPTSPG
ncbi:MAG: hypothetical protein HDR77_04930 [Bacteroides sp.]|nr:hypothetical protein [Bacteroides sp.]